MWSPGTMHAKALFHHRRTSLIASIPAANGLNGKRVLSFVRGLFSLVPTVLASSNA
jgi:hypothetical protein